ncbi:MAG TPA: hypothetical protein VFQ54_00320 [Thermomicrobiales bacterium]|nr:hypothetical protein [Thermomicrobiales bacterium]
MTPDNDSPDETATPNGQEHSRNRNIETLRYEAAVVPRIAELLDVKVQRAPFRLPSSTVWQLTVPGTQGRPVAMITLWPELNRVDVIAGSAAIVFTDVRTVDLVPGVEVQFRRGSREFLIVARGGRVIVRA